MTSLAAMVALGTAMAQTPLFISLEPADPGGSPLPTVHAYYDIEIEFEAMKHAPEQLEIVLPDGSTFVADRTEFLYRSGFMDRQEWDPPGTPPIYPIPGIPDDWFSYRWVGHHEDYDVALTVIEGRMTGLINGTNRYLIQRQRSGNYRMAHIRMEGFQSCVVGQSQQGKKLTEIPDQVPFQFDMLREIIDKSPSIHGLERGSSTVRVDILVPWTEQARINAGGLPGDPYDTQPLYDLIQTAIDNTQTTFQNSLTSTRVTRYITARLTGFTLTGDPFDDLETLRDNPSMASYRNQTGTDLVAAVIYGTPSEFPACGVAYVQTFPGCGSPNPNCDSGPIFEADAYTLISSDCALADNTFTHEIGHLFGGNHARNQLPASWINAVVANGFPEAFAKIVPNTFASIMSIDFNTSRRLYFSNPSVFVNGVATGNLGTEDNARIVELLSPDMEDFRQRPELIFADGFQ